MTNFDAANLTENVDRFAKALQSLMDAHWQEHYPDCPANQRTVQLEVGTRYIRVVARDPHGSGSAWGFIDRRNGDILKAASWKAPAKHARGSIFNANPLKGCGVYGPNYLR